MTTSGADWILPDWPVPPTVRALVTTRAGGASRGPYASFNLDPRVGDDPSAVERNREALRSALPADPQWLHQVHGAEVVAVESAAPRPRADGAVARTRHAVCAVLTADCLPVLLASRAGDAVGIAHAGWRGLAAGVVEAVVGRMGAPAANLIAWLGPAIGPRAYEVGQDVFDAFVAADPGAASAFAPLGVGKHLADLYALARRRLAAAGVTAVHGGGFCTHAEPARFYSYRRDRTTGRFASLVWME
jgi:YfiH family protein